MLSPLDFLTVLKQDQLFLDWHQGDAFCSHFFCPIDKELHSKGEWEVGFYNPDHNKITVFTKLGENFIIKPEDEVFKKEMDKVEKLELDKVKISYQSCGEKFLEEIPNLFPNEILGDGFIVLQELDGTALWNFTLITKTLKFVNVKLNAENGKVVSHQAVELMQKN
tara:strand:+ start:13271 stop:13768 length:498 start_codon:yes stop_codon:yes gene_type:complete